MAEKKFLDQSGLSYYHQKQKAEAEKAFVAKEDGKVLSSNDYTTLDKEKLAAIEAGAEVNVIDEIKVNGKKVSPEGTAVDIEVPTKTSDLENDDNFQTQSEVASAISSAIAGVTQFDYQVVDKLPDSGVKGTIYLTANSSEGTNAYDEYLWINGKWEKIGTTEVDLSDYYNKAATDGLLANKADKSTTYTKDEVDAELEDKADAATTLDGYGITDAYTKQQADTLLNAKLDTADLVAIANGEIDAIFA